jgi:hypothetical protein
MTGFHLEPIGAGDVVPETTEVTAQDVVAQVVDTCGRTGLLLPGSWRGIIGRHAKGLLADGFPPDMVTGACYMAVLRGRPEIAQHIAGDIMLAHAGQKMSRTEYESKLALYAADQGRDNPFAKHQARKAERSAEIERRRNGAQ